MTIRPCRSLELEKNGFLSPAARREAWYAQKRSSTEREGL